MISNLVHLTFDIDWAPDWAVEKILFTLAQQKRKATFFLTHNSSIIQEIEKEGHHIGLHPNFLKGSTHGTTVREVMDSVRALYPKANCIRTHGLYQSTNLFYEIFKYDDILKYDMSICMHRFSKVEISDWYFNEIFFKRINYNWEDDFCFYEPGQQWDVITAFANIHIINFHPIHIALNSDNGSRYTDFKKKYAHIALQNARESQVNEYRNNGVGTCTYFEKLLNSDFRFVSFAELLCELG